MTEKLARRGLSVPGEYEAIALKTVRVADVMRKEIQPISPDTTVAELAARMDGGPMKGASATREAGPQMIRGLPIAGSDGKLLGVITQGDLLRALENDPQGATTVLEAG